MSDKISALTELTDPALEDELVIVDKSDTTQDTSGTTKRITRGNTLKNVPYIVTGFEDYIVLGGGTRDLTQLNDGNKIFGTGAFYGGAVIYGTVNTTPPTQDSHITVTINLGTGS